MNTRAGFTVAVGLLVSCTFSASGQRRTNPNPQPTDYSQPGHWLAVPARVDKAVDVFYLYPTAWQRASSTAPYICEIDNASMMIGSQAAYGRQATAFETIANIYAPYYRQADAMYTLSLPVAEQAKVVGGIPKLDAFAAFDYYIRHFNKGRPFILAGHSQGSNVLIYLLSEYMRANPKVYARMIAAYVIGYSVTDSFLQQNPHLRFATGPDDTGVIISYNTQSPYIAKGANPVVLDGALAINPITWTRDEMLATTAEGLGSFMPDETGALVPVPQYADAQIDIAKGVVVCSTADVSKLRPGLGIPGVFHSYDYPFYYFNLRENAGVRTSRFLGMRRDGRAVAR